MGGTSRDRWLAALRPLILAALLTAAWLAWAAGSANAASDSPSPLGSLGSFGQPAVTLYQEASSAAAAVSGLPHSARAPAAGAIPSPVPAPAPALQGVPVRVAAAPLPVSGAAATVVDVVDPLLSDTADVVTTAVKRAAPAVTDVTSALPTGPVTETVTQTVTDTVDTVVSVAHALTPALPGTPLPSIPLPTVQLPTVPLPTAPLPTVPLPAVHLPTLPVHVPALAGPRSAPGAADPSWSLAAEPEGRAGAGVDAAAGSVSSETAAGTAAALRPLLRSVAPSEFLANTHVLATLAATVGYTVAADPAPAPAPQPDGPLRFAAVQGQSGSASAGAGSGEGAADVAGAWNPLHDALGALRPDASQFPSAGPSYDPGSSPD